MALSGLPGPMSLGPKGLATGLLAWRLAGDKLADGRYQRGHAGIEIGVGLAQALVFGAILLRNPAVFLGHLRDRIGYLGDSIAGRGGEGVDLALGVAP